MIRRLLWISVGAAGAVFAVRYFSRAVESYSPEGLAQRAVGIAGSARDFGASVMEGMNEREAELREGFLPEKMPDQGFDDF